MLHQWNKNDNKKYFLYKIISWKLITIISSFWYHILKIFNYLVPCFLTFNFISTRNSCETVSNTTRHAQLLCLFDIWTQTPWSRSPCVTWISRSVSNAQVWPLCAVFLCSVLCCFQVPFNNMRTFPVHKTLEKQP
jgi:hypothetical protein